jgi:KDO2-lipid IV(A) lauroyltransferase
MSSIKLRALNALFSWFGRIKPSTRQRIGAALAWFIRHVAKSRVRIVRLNLQLCFPELSEHEREREMRAHFRALAQSIVDRGVLWYGTPEAIQEMVSLKGADRINTLIAEGRRVLLLAPHFVALDAAATVLTMVLPSSATMYTPQSDAAVDTIVRNGRGRFNEVFLVSRKDGVRHLIRHLQAPRPVYYLPDMDFGRQGAVFVPFFGIPAATLEATAQLARRWDTVVLPIIDFWDPATGKYQVEVLDPLEDFPGEGSLEEATARLNQHIESWVRRCPSQYYWVHRRFKTRPLGEAKYY